MSVNGLGHRFLYRTQLDAYQVSGTGSTPEVMGAYCGGLEGATVVYETLMQNKVMTWGGDVRAHKHAVHINLGEAHAPARAAGIPLERLVVATEACMHQREFSVDTRVDLKMRAGYIADLCHEGVNAMLSSNARLPMNSMAGIA